MPQQRPNLIAKADELVGRISAAESAILAAESADYAANPPYELDSGFAHSTVLNARPGMTVQSKPS
jgi:hypothetical protein